jgi:predicted permease
LHNLDAVDPGFDARGVTVLSITSHLGAQERNRQLAVMHELQLRSEALTTVRAASTAWMPMFAGGRRAQRVVLPGQSPSDALETFYRVSPGYLATLHIPLLHGRDFTFTDNDDEPVASIVNRAFAKKYFGRESALGLEFRRDDGVRHRIIGIAGDSRYGDLRHGPEPIVYMPMKPTTSFTMYVQSKLDAGSVAKMVEREAAALGSGMRIRNVTTLESLVGGTLLKEKLLAGIGAVFAFLGLTLAAVGLFGLLNYTVTRRTKEFSIRTALGARRLSLYVLIVKDVTRMMAGGLAAGLVGFFILMHFATSLLFETGPADPLVIGTATIVFLGVALLAGAFPAHRAAVLDPVQTLRHD